MKETAFTWLFIGAIIYWVAQSIFHRDEIIKYQMFCKDGAINGTCKTASETANTTTYKVLAEQQLVVYWSEDNGTPKTLKICSVRNTNNWNCQLGDKYELFPSITWQMVDGKFIENIDPDSIMFGQKKLFYSVSKWQWWFSYLSQKIGGKQNP